MKILQILVLMCGLVAAVNAQKTPLEEKDKKAVTERSEKKELITLRGKVTFSKKTVEGAYVRVLDEKYKEYVAKTDSEGNYVLKLPTGRYRIMASQPIAYSTGCHTPEEKLFLKDKKKVKLNLTLVYCGCG